MDLSLILLSIFIGGFVYLVIKRITFLKKLPPGPWGLPVIGQLVHLNRNNALKEFQKWKDVYGKIFSFAIGDFYVIVINDYKMIMDTLKRHEFLGRPDFEAWTSRNMGKKDRGILFSDGVHSWTEQRRFTLRTLRDFGFGKESMEGLLQSELELLIERFRHESIGGKPIEMRSAFNASVFNSLWLIATGMRFELDDPEFHKVLSMFQGHLTSFTITNPGSFYPWPAKFNLIRKGVWKKMLVMYKFYMDLNDNLIQEHLDTYDENQTRDFIDSYLHHAAERQSDPESSFNAEEARANLKIVLLDFFTAETETSSTTLLWAVLYMTEFPEVQKKLQNEIDDLIGQHRLPVRDDKPNLIYLEAFTNELHRKASLVPMSVYRKMLEDVEYEGHLFPKGTVIFPNLYEAHHNKDYWGDPENFRPERFLDETGTKLIRHEALMPFSTGKRLCLGETFARDTLFIFLAGLLQVFTFERDPESPPVDLNQMKPMFVVAPDPFKIIIKARK